MNYLLLVLLNFSFMHQDIPKSVVILKDYKPKISNVVY
jgi:hypothetical protein